MPAPLGLAQAAPASSAARMAALLHGIGRATDPVEAPQPAGFVRLASFSPGAGGATLALLDLANRRELALDLAARFDSAQSELERELHVSTAAFVLVGTQPAAPRLSRDDLQDAVRAARTVSSRPSRLSWVAPGWVPTRTKAAVDTCSSRSSSL